MRGDLKAVVRAILLDPEARGDVKTDADYGHLKEPVLFVTNILRAFNAHAAPTPSPSDGYLDPYTWDMSQDVFRPDSVFSYYPADFTRARARRLAGPEFGILSATTALARANFLQFLLFWGIDESDNGPKGTALDLSRLQTLAAASPDALLSELDRLLLHGTMSDDMRSSIRAAVVAMASDDPDLRRAAGPVSGGDVLAVPGREVSMDRSRREFLVRTGCAALGMAAFQAGLDKLGPDQRVRAAARAADYRALVCIFLGGGNDGNNMIVPLDAAGFQAYSDARTGSGLALDQGQLLSVTPATLGTPFGLHPSMTQMPALFSAGKLAVVANVGPLVQPLTRAQFQNGDPQPYALFSHSDQVTQWQTARADVDTRLGWGGRTGDFTAAMNSGAIFPIVTSVNWGTSLFGLGMTTRPLGIAPAPTPLDEVLVLYGFYGSTGENAAADLDEPSAHDRPVGHAGRRHERRDPAGLRHQPGPLDGSVDHDVVPGLGPRQPAPAGRQADQAEPDGADAAQAADLLLRDGRVRHAHGPAHRPGRPARRAVRRDEGLLRRDGRARRRVPASRRSRSPTSGARSSPRATAAASAPTTAGATTSS